MPKKILIVEDEDNVLKILKMVLEGNNFEVFAASDGQEALEKIENIFPDLVIADLSMPNIDGGELCRLIKQSPKFSNIKVVICSALSKEVAEKKVYLPADDYLVKPVDMEILLKTVNNLFQEKS